MRSYSRASSDNTHSPTTDILSLAFPSASMLIQLPPTCPAPLHHPSTSPHEPAPSSPTVCPPTGLLSPATSFDSLAPAPGLPGLDDSDGSEPSSNQEDSVAQFGSEGQLVKLATSPSSLATLARNELDNDSPDQRRYLRREPDFTQQNGRRPRARELTVDPVRERVVSEPTRPTQRYPASRSVPPPPAPMSTDDVVAQLLARMDQSERDALASKKEMKEELAAVRGECVALKTAQTELRERQEKHLSYDDFAQLRLLTGDLPDPDKLLEIYESSSGLQRRKCFLSASAALSVVFPG